MKTFSILRTLTLAGLLLGFAFASPASAQHVCQDDAFRLCNEFIPDRAKVASCLFKQKRQLSPGCRAEMGGGGKKTASKKGKGKGKAKKSKRKR